MSEVQDIFNTVFDAGYYSEFTDHGSVLMCHALKNAARNGVINKEQFILAHKEVVEYLSGFGSIGGFLSAKGVDWDFTARLAIYQTWDNKPSFKK